MAEGCEGKGASSSLLLGSEGQDDGDKVSPSLS